MPQSIVYIGKDKTIVAWEKNWYTGEFLPIIEAVYVAVDNPHRVVDILPILEDKFVRNISEAVYYGGEFKYV